MAVIDRVHAILEILMLHNHKGMRNKEISEKLNLSTSTCNRLLQSLEAIGVVWQNPSNQRYYLGNALLKYADAILESLDDVTTCLPYLEDLHSKTKETTYYARFSGLSCVTTEICGYINSRISVRRGETLPLHATASGMAVLAFIPQWERKPILDRIALQRFTPHTITDSNHLDRVLARITKTGVAMNFGGLHNGINALATPIFNRERVLGSITIVGTAANLPKNLLEEYSELFLKASANITSALGGDFSKWVRIRSS